MLTFIHSFTVIFNTLRKILIINIFRQQFVQFHYYAHIKSTFSLFRRNENLNISSSIPKTFVIIIMFIVFYYKRTLIGRCIFF